MSWATGDVYQKKWGCDELLMFDFLLMDRFDALFFPYGLSDALFSPILSISSQTVEYFNNEAFEADQYDEYLKSKLS